MFIIIAFITASFVASTLVMSALALSSRLSQKEGLEESYAPVKQTAQTPAKSATPFSLN